MKAILLSIALFLSLSCLAGNSDKIVKDTTINKVVYHLYEGSKGGHYIVVTSKKTGKEYKRYFKQS